VVNESIHYDKDFLLAEAETLDSCGGYKTAKEKVVASHFANNCAECAIKVATDFNLALIHNNMALIHAVSSLFKSLNSWTEHGSATEKKLCRRWKSYQTICKIYIWIQHIDKHTILHLIMNLYCKIFVYLNI